MPAPDPTPDPQDRWTVTVMTGADPEAAQVGAGRLGAPARATVRGAGLCVQWELEDAGDAQDLAAQAGRWRTQGLDLVVLPGPPSVRRLLVADMDSTLIAQECLDELAEAWGVGDRVADITARAMAGELDFEAALAERVSMLAGAPVELVSQVLATRITPAPGAAELVAGVRAAGGRSVLVSGGFTAFSGPVAGLLGTDAHHANELQVRGGRLTGRVVPPVLGRRAKVERLRAERAAGGLERSQVVAVGDGANDLGMLQEAGLGVALHAKPAVADEVERWTHGARVDHADARAVLWLQGLG